MGAKLTKNMLYQIEDTACKTLLGCVNILDVLYTSHIIFELVAVYKTHAPEMCVCVLGWKVSYCSSWQNKSTQEIGHSSLTMADINTEVYAVVDKSRKKQALPEDETAESDSPPPIPERSGALDSEYPMTTADTLVTKETEKNSGVAFESTTVAASDATYSAITAENSAKKGEGAKKDANDEPTPGNHEGYATLQHSTTIAPAKPPRSFYSDYSMITLDDVHSTVNDGDLPQQPAETDMGTGKTVAKAAPERHTRIC